MCSHCIRPCCYYVMFCSGRRSKVEPLHRSSLLRCVSCGGIRQPLVGGLRLGGSCLVVGERTALACPRCGFLLHELLVLGTPQVSYKRVRQWIHCTDEPVLYLCSSRWLHSRLQSAAVCHQLPACVAPLVGRPGPQSSWYLWTPGSC